MNSLEFIDEEIKYWQKTINTARSEKLTQTIIVSLNPLYKVENATLSDYHILLIEEKIQTLQQIKAELETWEEKEKGVRVFKESKQDALCPICHHYINFDCLNDKLKYAPKYCCECGNKIIFTEEDVLKH